MALFPKLPMKLCSFGSAISAHNHHQNPNEGINIALFFKSYLAISESECPIAFEYPIGKHVQKENEDGVWNE
jgi:hypothetical protein